MPERRKLDLRSILAKLNSFQYSSYWLIAVLVIMLATLYGMRMYEVRAALLQPVRAGITAALVLAIAMTCRSYWVLRRRTAPAVWRDHGSEAKILHRCTGLGLTIALVALLMETWTFQGRRAVFASAAFPIGLVFATLPLIGLRRALRRLQFHSNRALNLCVSCGYNLSGVGGRKCPECGTMNPAPTEREVDIPPQ